MLKTGTKCWLKGPASRESLNAWNLYRSRGLPLLCPCHCLNMDLKVIKVLSSKLVLLQPVKSSSQLTIAVWTDLTTLKPETI